MYIRTVTRKNKDNSEVRYIQVAHNFWDPKARRSKTKVLLNLGREEEVDKEALKRLVSSIARFLGPEEVLKAGAELSGKNISFVSSRELGGTWLLEKLWKNLGIQATLRDLLKARAYQYPVERALFAMVANRALAPTSKLAVEDWVRDEVWIKDLPEVPVHQLYRAMDFLLEAAEEVQKEVFFATANLFNLEVDLIY